MHLAIKLVLDTQCRVRNLIFIVTLPVLLMFLKYAKMQIHILQLFGHLLILFMGEIQRYPFSEKDRTDQPTSLYIATKKAGEEIAHMYNHIYGLSLTGLRFSTVYGPWDILKRKPIPIFESGNHWTTARDFTYIDGVVKGCLGALDTTEKSTGSGGKKKKGLPSLEFSNLGNTLHVRVSDLVSILEKLLKVKAKRRVMNLPRNGDVPFTHANISLAQMEFGYKPMTDLQTVLKKFLRWYEKYYGSGKKSDH
ncbi:putative UDP-glucuronate 4-epimerase [Helianthus annuus]|nr:putative UDP-glucuronate 4-epimerase [Helianthus annuus]KAJ0803734.1 putative UDP-glucuronate 4-epimerase [Helianthus annuus]